MTIEMFIKGMINTKRQMKQAKFTSNPVRVRFTPEILKKIDNLIEKNKFDSRASFVRRAVSEFIENREKTIY